VLLVTEDDRAPVHLPRAIAIAACTLAASQSFGTGTAAAIVFPMTASLLRPGLLARPMSAAAVWCVPLLVALAARMMFTIRTRLNPAPEIANAFDQKDWSRTP
jgi:hypothetical protein